MKEVWDQRYRDQEYYYGETENQFLRDHVSKFPAGSKVLCIAEGEGRNAVFLASLGYDVTAVDFSEKARGKALRLAEKRGVKINYIITSLEDFEFGEKCWDGIISIFAHLPSHLREVIYPRMEKSLKEGGIFLIEAYTPLQLEFRTGGPKDLDMLMTTSKLREELPLIEWDRLVEEKVTLSEGKGHLGESAVVHGYGVKRMSL